MFTTQTLLYAVYVLAAASAILLIEAVYLAASRKSSRDKTINRRMRILSDDESNSEALQNLLEERGLSKQGDYTFGIIALNRLYTQSGVSRRPIEFVAIYLSIGIVLSVILWLFRYNLVTISACLFLVLIVLPILHLRRARKRRIRAIETQLPNALDMIVRSLRAGHPTSVAAGLVAREMPDPIGTEFGIMFDEITFGQSLENATKKLAERVGDDGLRLLAVSLSIQSKTGGNLTDILKNLSTVLRERAKLRLKIRALSAEGRVSAIMISSFPFVMFGLLLLIAPSYYGDIWDDPLVFPVFAVFGVLALIGDYMMYRMVTFDF